MLINHDAWKNTEQDATQGESLPLLAYCLLAVRSSVRLKHWEGPGLHLRLETTRLSPSVIRLWFIWQMSDHWWMEAVSVPKSAPPSWRDVGLRCMMLSLSCAVGTGGGWDWHYFQDLSCVTSAHIPSTASAPPLCLISSMSPLQLAPSDLRPASASLRPPPAESPAFSRSAPQLWNCGALSPRDPEQQLSLPLFISFLYIFTIAFSL